MIIYLSGKYTDDTEDKVQENCLMAKRYAIDIWNKGHYCFSPHLNTWRFEKGGCNASYNDYLDFDKRILCICDAIFMLPNWKSSYGATDEKKRAEELGLKVYYELDELPSPEIPEHLKEVLYYYDEFICKARQRIIMGARQYGDDWRRKNNLKEIEPEIFDIPNYAALHYAQLQHILHIDKQK